MAIQSQCEITPPDPERFVAAVRKYRPLLLASGATDDRLYRSTSEPERFVWVEDWDSQDAMEAATDRFGPRFDEEAGVEGVEWRTTILSPVEV
jgi:hypothetical protein